MREGQLGRARGQLILVSCFYLWTIPSLTSPAGPCAVVSWLLVWFGVLHWLCGGSQFYASGTVIPWTLVREAIWGCGDASCLLVIFPSPSLMSCGQCARALCRHLIL